MGINGLPGIRSLKKSASKTEKSKKKLEVAKNTTPNAAARPRNPIQLSKLKNPLKAAKTADNIKSSRQPSKEESAEKHVSFASEPVKGRAVHETSVGRHISVQVPHEKSASLEPTVEAATVVVKNPRKDRSGNILARAISGKHVSKPETNIGAVAQIVKARNSQNYMDYRSAAEQLADLAAEADGQPKPDEFLKSKLTVMCKDLTSSDLQTLAKYSVVGISGYGDGDAGRSELGEKAAKALEGVLKELGYTTEAI